MWRFTSALLRIKSHCHARFSAFVASSQLWETIIHCEIRCGAQPFPKQNIISLNDSLSPIGFAQNILWYSSGHHFKGKNASPFIIWNSSLRSAIISCLESKRTCCDTLPELPCLRKTGSLEFLSSFELDCSVSPFTLSKNYLTFFVVLISMRHSA